jgi:hypothetical protein
MPTGSRWHINCLRTINPTQTGMGLNPGLRGDRPANNRLSHYASQLRTGYVNNQQFNIHQLYALHTLYEYLYVLYLSENKQRLVPLTA